MAKYLKHRIWIIIVCVLFIFAGYFFVMHKLKSIVPSSNTNSSVFMFAGDSTPANGFAAVSAGNVSNKMASGPLLPSRMPPPGFQEYRNIVYRFSIFYPISLSVKEVNEGNGVSTVIFQNVKDAKGFQIFIVPYEANQVSRERFQKDEPSEIMNDPNNLNIDGAIATMFLSRNLALGATREVWFIKNGYLFEVTAPQTLDNWLGYIMQTWKFI
jgi:hypothetical protein